MHQLSILTTRQATYMLDETLHAHDLSALAMGPPKECHEICQSLGKDPFLVAVRSYVEGTVPLTELLKLFV